MTQADIDRNEIIEMAKFVVGNYEHAQYWPFFTEELEHFAKRVADVATAKEREACAKVCEPTTQRPCDCDRCDCGNSTDARMVAEWDEAANLAAAIRERGEQQ